jgi:tRNA 2-thiouridine synthesizing protein E
MFGMVRATKHEDVQKGMALLVEVLKRIGHGANELAAKHQKNADKKARLAEILGPRRSKKLLGVERPRLPPGESERIVASERRAAKPTREKPVASAHGCAVPSKPAQAATVIDGIAYSADGHMVDAGAWTRPIAEAIAQMQGVTMTDAHWTVIDAARADFAATAASPNIRRLTQITSFTTKDLYALFPKAPARTIAKIAGLPKPAGCL